MNGVLTVFTKEIRDVLRDRRSIVAMVLVPILFYPIVTIGLGTVISSQLEKTEKERQPIMLLPAAADAELRNNLSLLENLRIVSIDSLRALFLTSDTSEASYQVGDFDRLIAGEFEFVPDSVKRAIYYSTISEDWAQAVLEMPVQLSDAISEGDTSAFRVFIDETDMKSEIAGSHIIDWIESVKDSVVAGTLINLNVDPQILSPLGWTSTDVAPSQKKSRAVLALFLPYFLIILNMSGGMYPALDITAGEKERKTLETLLASPVHRWQIALGKFLTVFLAGMVSMLLAVVSLVLNTSIGATSFMSADSPLPIGLNAGSIVWIVALMIPLSMLFSALLITVCISARSFKEGQSYVTPLMLMVIVPAMITFVPGMELNWELTFVPVINLCLALKDVLMGIHRLPLIFAVFATTSVYAGFMLFVTTRIFQRESVLFRT